MDAIVRADTQRALDFLLVLEGLAGFSQTPMGRRALLELEASDDRDELDRRHQLVDECRVWVAREGGLSLGEARPLDDALKVVQVEGTVLDPPTLLTVRRTATVARRARGRLAGQERDFPRLASLGSEIADLGPLVEQIDTVLDDEGEVRDDASPELASLRRRKRKLRKQVQEKLQQMVKSSGVSESLQERIVTRRGGRYVVPLRSDKRGALKGVVHDTSSSGQTLYVEPLEVVDQQNALAEVEREEEREIQRLLADLTAHVRAARRALAAAQKILGRLDALLAVTRFAEGAGAVRPELVDRGIEIIEARHPLFVEGLEPEGDERRDFVPLDLRLGPDDRSLIITGPNTGGKTVALKTVGLLVLMALCGLPVPARRAVLPRCPRVHADIGDEQSVVANLSTFSAHLTRIHAFLEDCPTGSLVLLDELGTGTDPAEGAALGVALLERFEELGALTLVSTHHDTLKAFGHAHDGAINAAMEFDSATLQPTYRLRVGLPGRSNAFEIAARLGVDDDIVERARSLLSGDAVELDELLRSVEDEAEALASDRRAVEEERRRLERARHQHEERLEELAELRGRLRDQARAAVEDEVEAVRRRGEQLLAELEEKISETAARSSSKRAAADRRAAWAARASGAASEVRRHVDDSLEDAVGVPDWATEGAVWSTGPQAERPEDEEQVAEDGDGPLARGDPVRVESMGLRGRVARDWHPDRDEGEVEVDVHGKRLLVGRQEVTRLSEKS